MVRAPSLAVLLTLGILSAARLPGQTRQLFIGGAGAGYLEADACAPCHKDIAETYARTAMGRSFSAVHADARLPEFAGQTFYHAPSEQVFTAFRKDGRYYLSRHQAGPDGAIINLVEKQVDYVLGSGNHARSYLHRASGGRLVQAPVTWYSDKGGYWAMSTGYDRPNHPGFSREIGYNCLFCHNGYPEVEPGADYPGASPVLAGRVPNGIDCQRCHGPGREHVAAAQESAPPDQVRRSIVNPARLSSERQMEICMQCHLETTSQNLPAALVRFHRGVFSYRPGEPLADYALHFDHAPGTGRGDKFEFVSAVYRLRKSRCFQAGTAMTCTTCHNPHDTLRGGAAERHYTGVCLQCHGDALAKRPVEDTHRTAQECMSCHMPKRRPSDAVHVLATDHYIRARPDPEKPGPLVEEHDGNTPPYRGEVVLYYPPEPARNSDDELYLAVAQVKHQSNLEEGIRRLERAIGRRRPKEAGFYFELAEAYRSAGQIDKAIRWYDQALTRAPGRWMTSYAKGLVQASAGRLDDAAETLRNAQSIAPFETRPLHALGEVYARQGRTLEAVLIFRKTLELDPELAEVWNNLGAELLRMKDLAAGENTLREAVRLRPDIPAARINLAYLLSSQGNFRDAKDQFERALRMGAPAEEATYNNLGTVYVRLGDLEGAVRQYRKAIALNPDSLLAHFNLGLTLTQQDRFKEAVPHLQKAAQSPDAALRRGAEDLLHKIQNRP